MRYGILALLILIALSFAFLIHCGDTAGSPSGGAGGGVPVGDDDTDDDDDDDVVDPTGCVEALDKIYGCSSPDIHFLRDGQAQSKDEALTECLALNESEDAWVCRLNCAGVLEECSQLYDCLMLCPSMDEEEKG